MPSSRTRVLLADDNQELLQRLVQVLGDEFDVIGSVTDGCAVLEAASTEPDLVVLDIFMPALNGIDAAHRLAESGSKAKIVFLSVHDDPDFAREALATGALGYVVKERMASDLIPAIREALAGRSFVSPSVALEDAL